MTTSDDEDSEADVELAAWQRKRRIGRTINSPIEINSDGEEMPHVPDEVISLHSSDDCGAATEAVTERRSTVILPLFQEGSSGLAVDQKERLAAEYRDERRKLEIYGAFGPPPADPTLCVEVTVPLIRLQVAHQPSSVSLPLEAVTQSPASPIQDFTTPLSTPPQPSPITDFAHNPTPPFPPLGQGHLPLRQMTPELDLTQPATQPATQVATPPALWGDDNIQVDVSADDQDPPIIQPSSPSERSSADFSPPLQFKQLSMPARGFAQSFK